MAAAQSERGGEAGWVAPPASGGVSRRLRPAAGAGGEQQRWRGGVGDGHDEDDAEVGRPICYFLDASVCSIRRTPNKL